MHLQSCFKPLLLRIHKDLFVTHCITVTVTVWGQFVGPGSTGLWGNDGPTETGLHRRVKMWVSVMLMQHYHPRSRSHSPWAPAGEAWLSACRWCHLPGPWCAGSRWAWVWRDETATCRRTETPPPPAARSPPASAEPRLEKNGSRITIRAEAASISDCVLKRPASVVSTWHRSISLMTREATMNLTFPTRFGQLFSKACWLFNRNTYTGL